MTVAHASVARRCFGLAAICIFLASAAWAQADPTVGQWHYYGGDAGSKKYAPLDQIDRGNVQTLKIAWTWDSADRALQKQNPALNSYTFENTPLMVRGTLYVSTSLSQVAAIDARNGQTLWVFNPESYKAGRPTNMGYVHRGVAYWTDGAQERIFMATHDAFLYALEARTGRVISEFGEGGRVNLAAAIPLAINARNYTVTSPPTICRNIVIVGSSISDGPQTKEAPRGDIQGFDVRTGKPAWLFHSVPQAGEPGNETWENNSWQYTGNTNAWSIMTADEELGYFYIPFGTPTNDWYGGQRLGDNLYAESLVCLEATTGRLVWHFQTVHHGLWDYDLPAAPVLCDIKVDGRPIKAVVATAKTGFAWVFDRVNGKPVWPIEERPVAQSTVPGERSSPTQPFPTKPAPFERQGTTEDNLIDFTPQLRAEAKSLLSQVDCGPLFTPPTEKGTLTLPGWGGGSDWWGAAFDPETGMLYIPSVTSPIVIKLVKPDAARSNFDFVRGFGPPIEGPQGLPLFKPPYARITAIDLNTGNLAWMVPHGDGPRQKVSELVGRDVGPLGGGIGGPLLTRSLLFVGQGANNLARREPTLAANMLRAYDKTNGQLLAAITLPGRPSGTPMTYSIDGRQYIVIATADGQLVALSLPG